MVKTVWDKINHPAEYTVYIQYFGITAHIFCAHAWAASFPAVIFIVKLRIFSVRGSWITECCLGGCWTTRSPPNLKAAVQLWTARTPLKKSWVESGWSQSCIGSTDNKKYFILFWSFCILLFFNENLLISFSSCLSFVFFQCQWKPLT